MAQAILSKPHKSAGGNSLNFRVIGGVERPANPQENTIWINTDLSVEKYIFSATEPYVTNSSKSIYTASANTADYFITSSGGTQGASDRTATGYMELPLGTYEVNIPKNTGYYSTVGHAWYDASKKFISWFNPNSTSITVSPPANAKYLRCSIFDNDLSSWSCTAKYKTVDAEDGTVWISTAEQSKVRFNSLRKNMLMVYPLMAYQSYDNNWNLKTAESFMNGTWKPWRINIFPGTAPTVVNAGSSGAGGSATATTATITVPNNSNINSKTYRWVVDVTNVSTLTVKYTTSGNTGTTGSNSVAGLAVYSGGTGSTDYAYYILGPGQNGSPIARYAPAGSGAKVYTLDVSNRTGTISIIACCYTNSGGAITLTVTDIYLE